MGKKHRMKNETVEFIQKMIKEERQRRESSMLDCIRHSFANMDKRIEEYQEITAVEDDFGDWFYDLEDEE